jgi:hypothetical protein
MVDKFDLNMERNRRFHLYTFSITSLPDRIMSKPSEMAILPNLSRDLVFVDSDRFTASIFARYLALYVQWSYGLT